MENNNDINIAEILRDCPKDTKLYSPLFGEVELKTIHDLHFPIVTEIVNEEYKLMSKKVDFTKDGTFFEIPNTECMIFPSQKMRDWSKFFKRGDVVRSIDDGAQAVFKGWESDDYTSFYASIVHHAEVDEWDEDVVFAVESFYKESEEFARGFIVDAEEHYNGKYNPDTLRVEQSVKPECPFRPFDKVLVRDHEGQIWNTNYFLYYRENNKDFLYACMDNPYRYCIPYEGNEHLLGTTDPYTKGGME